MLRRAKGVRRTFDTTRLLSTSDSCAHDISGLRRQFVKVFLSEVFLSPSMATAGWLSRVSRRVDNVA